MTGSHPSLLFSSPSLDHFLDSILKTNVRCETEETGSPETMVDNEPSSAIGGTGADAGVVLLCGGGHCLYVTTTRGSLQGSLL